MHKTMKDLSLLLVIALVVTLLIWLPHLSALKNFWGLNFEAGFNTIYRNFDGLEYVVIAKTFYKPELVATLPQSQPANYFASHFPGYAILINVFAPFLGYLKSMLFVSLLSTIFAVGAFYLLLKDFKLTKHPLFLSSLFLILPARWTIVHSVGSSEPTFILFIITAIYFFMKFEQSSKALNIFLSGVAGMLAQLIRPPGILLFIALVLFVLFKKPFLNRFKYFPLLLVPLSLLSIFYLYQQNLGDFWAYFHSGDNIHLTFPPFQFFNKDQFWVGDIWLEDIVYIFILGFLGAAILLKQKLYPVAFFVLTYLAASSLVAHRDISRYILPITPFLLIAFEKVLTSREFKIILPIIAMAIYLYTQNFLLANVAPLPNPQLFN